MNQREGRASPSGLQAVSCGPRPARYLGGVAAHTFNVVYEDAGDGGVYAHVPELPEVHTQGESLDQAREMARDAIELVLEERRARDEDIPATR